MRYTIQVAVSHFGNSNKVTLLKCSRSITKTVVPNQSSTMVSFILKNELVMIIGTNKRDPKRETVIRFPI